MESYLPSKKSLKISVFSTLLDGKNLTNSYKIYWLYGILEEVKQGNKSFYFDKVISHMIAKSWYTLLEYKLNFGKSDKLEEIVKDLEYKYHISKNIPEKKLLKLLDDLKTNENKKVKNFHNYVPYRLLSPFYKKELQGKKESIKNKLIEKLSTESKDSIYEIRKKNITINNEWFHYIKETQKVIEGWLVHKLIIFLQTRNPNVPNIPFKLVAPQKRDLSKITKRWKELLKERDIIDIYSEKTIDKDISIDHFLPWSFVLHDQYWNLIPTTRSINSSKSNNLPDLEEYLERFCELQFQLYTFLKEKKYGKDLEEYFSLNLEDVVKKENFSKNLKNNIKPLFQIAENQGFSSGWRYESHFN